jgi:CarD family transcriptional regulator
MLSVGEGFIYSGRAICELTEIREMNAGNAEAYKTMKAVMAIYKQGDYVICSSGGVWRVDSADESGIRLSEHISGNTRTVPISGNDIVRAVASEEKILDAIDRICFIRTVQAANDKVRKEFYEEAMAKYDEIEWVKVIKSVYLRKQGGRLFRGEAEYAERAKSYFHGGISAVLGIPAGEVEAYISAAVSKL